MCDYSLHNVKSRAAQIADTLVTHNFGTGTRGFSAVYDTDLAVCVIPGTELSFAEDVTCISTGLFPWRKKTIKHRTAIFRQINRAKSKVHHDALEFPDGRIVLLTSLREGQHVTVLQLPAREKTRRAAETSESIPYVG